MIRTSTMLLAAMALCVSAAAQSNPDRGPVFAKTPTNIPFRLPLSSGTVDENTYKNDSLGLQITPPRGLKFGAPELKGKPGTVPLLVTVAPWGTAIGETVFYADDLGYYPEDRRSTKAYVERVVRNQKKEGVDLVEGKAEEQLGGVKFSRVDFHSTLNYQAVLVKACDVYAFVFIFAASDLESTNRLIAQTVVKLDMKASGCDQTTGATSQ